MLQCFVKILQAYSFFVVYVYMLLLWHCVFLVKVSFNTFI